MKKCQALKWKGIFGHLIAALILIPASSFVSLVHTVLLFDLGLVSTEWFNVVMLITSIFCWLVSFFFINRKIDEYLLAEAEKLEEENDPSKSV